jgi:type VI secretion system (T6SS) effector Hcp
MGAQRKRRKRRDEELEEREGRDPSEEAVQEKEEREKELTPADRVLALQKTAGNRAVGAAIARWGFATLPLAATPHWPKAPEMILDGEAMPISSFSFAGSAPAGTTGGGGSERGSLGSELTVTMAADEHFVELSGKTIRGDPIKTVVIVVPGKDGNGFTITLTDVFVSSVSNSGSMASVKLAFAKREFSTSPPQVQPRP